MNSQRIFTRTKLTALAASAMLLTACGSRESSSVSMVTDFAEEYRTSSAESLTENDNADIGHLRGIVRIVSENAVRIGTEDNNTQYTVSFGDEVSLADIHPGDLADITYSGEILEMYPSLIYGGESLEVIEKTDREYTCVERTLGVCTVSMLVPDGWEYSDTEYPPPIDGDEVTDFGITLSPVGSEGSITISWHSMILGLGADMDARTGTTGGLKSVIYTPKGSEVWSVILFPNLENAAVTSTFGESGDFSEYSSDIDSILSTLDIY